MDLLKKLNSFFNQSVVFGLLPNNEEKSEILMVNVLKEEFIFQRERLWFEIDLEWDRLIQIDSNKIKIENKSLSQDFLNTLSQFSVHKTPISGNTSFVFSNRMKNFSKQFLSLIESTFVNSNTYYTIKSISDSDSVSLILNESKDEIKLDTINSFSHKIDQIVEVLNFLYENFFKFKVFVNQTDQDGAQVKCCLMNIFSNLTQDQFSKTIHDNFIVNILPLSEFESNLHESLTQILTQFEIKLHKLEYKCQLSQQTKQTLDNLQEIYVRKKCKYLIENARNLMKDKNLIFDLVNTHELNKSIEKFENKQLVDLLKLQKSVPNSDEILAIPEFSISKFAHQFINLINQTLIEATNISNQDPKQIKSVSLFCLVTRNLFDLYSSVVPSFYFSNLKDLPKLSAILYNDFYYLSLHCLTLGHKYKNLISRLKSMKLNKNEFQYIDLQDLISNFNYIHLAPSLFMTGYEIIYNQVENQEKNLLELMYEDNPNGIREISEKNNYELFKKSLQKCILHLNNLASMWRDVLQHDCFKKIMGQLVNFVIKDLVKSCLKLEDISTDDADYLDSAFSILKNATNNLFLNNSMIDESSLDLTLNNNLANLNAEKYVESWQKFKYLMVILKASLQDIVDLWADEKGPLAMHFEANEVRSLMKALFMNTDRRQTALSKIK